MMHHNQTMVDIAKELYINYFENINLNHIQDRSVFFQKNKKIDSFFSMRVSNLFCLKLVKKSLNIFNVFIAKVHTMTIPHEWRVKSVNSPRENAKK